MNEQFVCKVKGCAAATEGRVFNHSRHLINHYRLMHGSKVLGQKQVDRQRKMAEAEARLAADQPGVIDGDQPFSELPEMVVETFDETGEKLPDQLSEEQQRTNRIGETNVDQILEEHEGRVGAQIEAVQARLDEASFELKRLQEEMTRVRAARKGYKMEVKARTAGDTPDEYA